MRYLSILFFVFSGFFVYSQSPQDIIVTVGDDEVSLEEFKYIYEKNNGKNADYSEKSLREYLDLYTNFKLKVQKAKEMRLDTSESLKKELAGYRSQLAKSFLTDKEVVDRLVGEIAERKKKDLLVRHILLKVNPGAPEKKKKEVLKKAENIYNQIQSGMPFSKAAAQYSQDRISAKKGGRLGWMTAALPSGYYDLENAIYGLKAGQVSKPVMSKLGYHIVKVDKIRPARGKIQIAHIFRKIDKANRKNQEEEVRLMDSIYRQIINGASFEMMVKKYSQDKTTSSKGGLLPPLGIGMYEQDFEDAAFALKKDGDVSKPIISSAGIHILKRIAKIEPPTLQEYKQYYKGRLPKMERYKLAQKSMIEKIKEENNFREWRNELDKFASTLDDGFYSYKWKVDPNTSRKKLLAFGDDTSYSVRDFAEWLKKQTRKRSRYNKNKPIKEALNELYDDYVGSMAIKYEQKNLEMKYPEFRQLMREYNEGILLFEATKIHVWDKANQDTVGLYEFYEKNKSMYTTEPSAKVGTFILNTTDQKLIKKVMKCAKKRSAQKIMKKFNKNGKDLIEYSEKTVELGKPGFVGLELKKNFISEPIIDKHNKKSKFRKVLEVLPSRRKSLKEARGYVVADYQDLLEKQWLKELKKRYPVRINESVLKKLIKH